MIGNSIKEVINVNLNDTQELVWDLVYGDVIRLVGQMRRMVRISPIVVSL